MRSSSPLLCWTWLAFVFFAFAPSTNAVKRGDFKTCAQSGFCRRLRDLPTSATSSPYSIKPESASFDKSSGLFTAEITSAIWPEAHFGLSIGITARDGLARLRVDEIGGLRQRYNETSRWALLAEPSFATDVEYSKKGSQGTLSWTHASHTQQARFSFSPLKIEFIRDGDTHIIFNEENLFHMEHFRVKKVGTDAQDPPDVEIDEQVKQSRQAFEPFMSEDGAWEETFNGHPDSKPKGMPDPPCGP
jgi:alpha 1,3-glucosidase